jgi:metal-responsive CopG/Arc/MetJ family transcriptional regulator
MKPSTIRISVYLPRTLHRKLHEEAARKGCSARQLVLSAIEQAIQPPRRGRRRLNLDKPLVRLKKPISITNEQIYELGIP